MLYQFTFKNFKSYKNETTFDMQAESINEFEESILIDKNGTRILPVSAIYGPNAGGKSGLLEALVCLTSIVIKPRVMLNIQKSEERKRRFTLYGGVIPYKFDEESKNEPTEFEIAFSTGSYEYKYSISILNDTIISESLYKKEFKGKKPAEIFTRKNGQVKRGEILKKANATTNVNEKIPYLTFISITNNIEVIKDVINWFENIEIINYASQEFENSIEIYDDEVKKLFLQLINLMDIDIEDYRLEEDKEKEEYTEFYTKHRNNDKEYELEFEEESEGTKKLFSLLPRILYVMVTGGVLIVDELDAKLHPKLLKYIIMIFKNPANKNHAQLIFTSQDLMTMSNQTFRRDEIWFACKNENKESEIYSLYDIRDENNERIRATASFSKQYLSGKYGADPYLAKMLEWGE